MQFISCVLCKNVLVLTTFALETYFSAQKENGLCIFFFGCHIIRIRDHRNEVLNILLCLFSVELQRNIQCYWYHWDVYFCLSSIDFPLSCLSLCFYLFPLNLLLSLSLSPLYLSASTALLCCCVGWLKNMSHFSCFLSILSLFHELPC